MFHSLWSSINWFFFFSLFQDKDETFEFPDIFEGKAPYSETELKDYKKMSNEQKREQQKNWDKIMIPSWFR